MFRQEQSEESTSVFDKGASTEILNEMSKEDARKKELIQSVLLGELHRLYIQHNLSGKNKLCVTVVDDGTHTCVPNKCAIESINGVCYSLPNERVHVCLQHPGYTCPAPAHFHRKQSMSLCNMLFCCRESGKAHICTPELCCADQEVREGMVHCRLTGKALLDAKLSHGWIEDEWRPVFKKQKTSRTKPKNQAIEVTCGGLQRRTVIDQLACFPKSEDYVALSEYISEFKMANKHSYNVVRSLMTGSKERDALDNKNMQRMHNRILTAWHRHIKQCTQSKTMIDMCELQLILKREMDTVTSCPVKFDKQRMDRLCQAYATHASAYIVQLLKHTNLAKQEVNWTDCIVALLYLQCNRFRLKDTVLIDIDPFLLQCLPPACSLGEFSLLKRNNFTNSKTSIQAAIIEACEKGTSLTLLRMPVMQLQDLI